MIDFRYHVVSIVAIFLALTLGIVLGSSLFNQELVKRLNSEITNLRNDSQTLRQSIRDLENSKAYRDKFIGVVEPQLIEGKLRGQSVVVVTLPWADSGLADRAAQVAQSAGATVTGRVAVKEDFGAAQQEPRLNVLVTNLASATGTTLPDGTALQRASALLASAIVTKDRTAVPPASTASPSPAASPAADTREVKILAGLREAGFIDTKDTPETRATLAVVVGGAPPTNLEPAVLNRQNEAFLALAAALAAGDLGTVVAGPAAAAVKDAVIEVVRRDGTVSSEASTVDMLDTPPGEVSVVWALSAELSGKTGHYGIVGRDGPLPSPPGENQR